MLKVLLKMGKTPHSSLLRRPGAAGRSGVQEPLRHDSSLSVKVLFLPDPGVQVDFGGIFLPHEEGFLGRLGVPVKVVHLFQAGLDEEGVMVRFVV